MNSMPAGVLIYFLVSGAVACIVHWKLNQYFLSTMVSTMVSPLAFVMVTIFHGESPHSFELKIVLFYASISLLISAIVGLPFTMWRRFLKQWFLTLRSRGTPQKRGAP